MLKLPVDDNPFLVMGIDPGTTTMGIAFISWDMVSRYYIVENAFTITAKSNDPHYESMGETHGSRIAQSNPMRITFLST